MKGVIKMRIANKIEAKYQRYAELSEKIFSGSLSDDETIELKNLSDELDEHSEQFYQDTIDKLENLLKKAQKA